MNATCDEMVQLIPWVVNGTAAEEKTRQLHLHVAGCAQCRRELAQAFSLQRMLLREMAGLHGPVAAPGPYPVLRSCLGLLEAAGLPEVVGCVLEGLLRAHQGRLGLRVNVPLAASVAL